MTKARSSDLTAYLDEVSRYLLLVKAEAKKSNQQLADYVRRTQGTISKAINKIHELDYRAVLVISEKTGVAIPASLDEAAKTRLRGSEKTTGINERARILADKVQSASPEVLEKIAELLERKSA